MLSRSATSGDHVRAAGSSAWLDRDVRSHLERYVDVPRVRNVYKKDNLRRTYRKHVFSHFHRCGSAFSATMTDAIPTTAVRIDAGECLTQCFRNGHILCRYQPLRQIAKRCSLRRREESPACGFDSADGFFNGVFVIWLGGVAEELKSLVIVLSRADQLGIAQHDLRFGGYVDRVFPG